MPNINLPLSAELLEGIDKHRGQIPRTAWIRTHLESAVHSYEDHDERQASKPAPATPPDAPRTPSGRRIKTEPPAVRRFGGPS